MNELIFKFDTGENIFFTSDTHFNHEQIINFCNRPFSTKEEMNQKLIENWNSIIKPNDYVFHLGDFAFGGSQLWNTIVDQLNGIKFFIIGNHDQKIIQYGFTKKFKWIGPQLNLIIEDQPLILNHYPFLCFAGAYHKQKPFILHGHVHSGPLSITGRDTERLSYCFPCQYDVGVDANNFTPISFNDLKEKINYQINNNITQYELIYKKNAKNK